MKCVGIDHKVGADNKGAIVHTQLSGAAMGERGTIAAPPANIPANKLGGYVTTTSGAWAANVRDGQRRSEPIP